MPKVEKKFVLFIKEHFDILLMISALAAGVLIRIPLLSAYAVADGSGGNIFHVIGDLLFAFLAMFFIRKTTGEKNKGVAIFVLLLILPSVFVSSAMCGRLENISFGFILLTLFLHERKEYSKAMIAYAIACGISIYAWLLLPFIIKTYGEDKKYNKLYCLIPLVPSVIRGALDNSYIPAGLVNRHLYEDCASFFTFLKGSSEKYFNRYIAICAVLFIFVICLLLTYSDKLFTDKTIADRLICALAYTETAALFVPGADSGASAFGALIALCTAFFDIRFIPVAVVYGYLRLIPMTGALYGSELMTFSLQGQTWIRIVVIIAVYALAYLRRDKKHVL